MKTAIKILVVEDEMIIAANLSLKLSKLGYEVSGIVPRGEEALVHIEQNTPDILLLDINLKGNLDGIETATKMLDKYNCVIIYLTANNDEATFNRAKSTRPFAFLSKPIKDIDLQRTLALSVERILAQRMLPSQENELQKEEFKSESAFLEDRIFVKHKDKMVKIFISDILYIAADRSYCQIFTKEDEYLISTPLKNVEDKLLGANFVRIHRSYLVNIKKIDEMTDQHVYIDKRAIPININAKDDLLKRLQRI